MRPGEYLFRVIACNNHGVWNETGAGFAFSIAPFYYQTWWFISGCTAAIVGSASAFYQYRLNTLRRIQQLEQQIALTEERQRLAKDLHDGLGANLTELAVLSEERLRKVARSTRESLHALRDIIWATAPRSDTVEGLISPICAHADYESFLGNAGLRCRFDVPLELPRVEIAARVRQNFFLAAKEALTNIVRHAEAGTVHIRVIAEKNRLRLAIEDDGQGFEARGEPSQRDSTDDTPRARLAQSARTYHCNRRTVRNHQHSGCGYAYTYRNSTEEVNRWAAPTFGMRHLRWRGQSLLSFWIECSLVWR